MYNEVIPVENILLVGAVASITSRKGTTVSSATQKPIGGATRNDIFVDIIEKLNVLFGSDGRILNYSIDGCIQVTSRNFIIRKGS